MAELLEVGAHSVTAILALWIGLLVITRAPRARGAAVFGFICALLVIWSVAIIVHRLTGDATGTVQPAVNLWEDVAAWLLPGATVHIALTIAFEGRWSRAAWAVLVLAYAIGAVGIAQAVLDPSYPIAFDEPNWEPFDIDGHVVAWTFSLARLGVWLAGVAYLARGLRAARADRVRRRQLLVALATVVLGVIGGMLRILPTQIGGDRWVGVSLVAVATLLATYAVLAQHIFLAPHVTTRAVARSLLGGVILVGYVGAVALADSAVRRALALDFPVLTALALVATVALFDPASSWVRRRLTDEEDRAEQRLLAALGADPVLAQSPDQALVPALERLVRTFELTGAVVEAADGRPIASAGAPEPEAPQLRLPLEAGDESYGVVAFSGARDRGSFPPTEMRALRVAASYLAASLRLAGRQDQQASALATLATERQAVLAQGAHLTKLLSDATTGAEGLHVFALGPLRAERDGEPLRRWGGPKAGSRQAEAVFAMLFDRGERGATKDEIIEIVWPDVDLDRADVAFHRTLLGLRSTLGHHRDGVPEPVRFHNDRYRLDPAAIAWSDVGEVERLLAEARTGDPDHAMHALEQVRALYRGDYMDDVPYFGDSVAVEERRDALRRQMHAVLLELAERYDARGDRLAAAASRRDAEALMGAIGELGERTTESTAR
jgi:DNA-binding SARP family transcriptional activator